MDWKTGIILSAVAVLIVLGMASGRPRPPAYNIIDPEDTQPVSIEPYEPRYGRAKPVVAVVAHHEGAELTDFVVPYGVLAVSGAARVVAVSTAPGPVEMFPSLTLKPDQTTKQFDQAFPRGADYVIVPAVHHPDDPVLTDWVKAQAARGATIVGVCDGVLVLAQAGLLNGRRATAHWFSFKRLAQKHPETQWVRDRRYVADGPIVTTTGVSASIPVALALVEAISGRTRAQSLADSLGIADWSMKHRSDVYGVSVRHLLTLLANASAVWNRESIGLRLEPGMDGITMALAADLWSRTYRSRVGTIASSEAPIRTSEGLRFVPDQAPPSAEDHDRWLEPLTASHAGSAIEHTLTQIADAYGRHTASLVALQVEHPWLSQE